jgi:phosphatidylglycerophosphatase C
MSDATGAVARKLVLFDFDGVLVAGDSFAGWLRREGLAPPLRRMLALLIAPLGLPLLRWERTRSLGARLFLHLAVSGAAPDTLRRSLDAYGRRLARRPERIIADGLAMLREHLAAGDRVVIVSGTETTLLHAILDTLQVHDVEVVASRLDFDRAGVRVVRHCFGAAKLSALHAVGIAPPWDVAYSDSSSDLPMLREAARAVCVNWPDVERGLAERALGRRVRFVTWR